MKFSKFTVLVALAFSSFAAQAAVSVTTGAGYAKMVQDLSAAYEAHGGKITQNYGGPIGQMVQQIAAGNGVNVVISDKGTLDNLKAPVKFTKTENLGSTPLVFIWRKGLSLTGPDDLAQDEVKSFAYPDAKAAIYGRAASSWLRNKKTEAINNKGKMVSAVPQVVAYVSKGEVDAGFVNKTAARAAKDKIGGSVEVSSGYTPINMVAVVVEGQEKDPDVVKFVDFLKSDKAKEILNKHGIN